jgi:hypothetical protein
LEKRTSAHKGPHIALGVLFLDVATLAGDLGKSL